MLKFSKQDSLILQFFLLILACTSIYGIREYVGGTLSGRLIWFSALFIIYFYLKKYKLPTTSKIYILSIIIGFFLHKIANVSTEYTFNNTILIRIIPVILLATAQQQARPPKTFIFLVFTFFFAECTIALYEKITLTHFIDYKSTENNAATSAIMLEDSTFRSFSLMFHPLYNANIISIILAFILCANFIKPIYKYFLILMGLASLWAFNSRGALITWGIILIYRVILYKAKIWYILVIVGLLYFALPPIIEWIEYSGLLGRLSDFDFSDSSTITRFEAFDVFFSRQWSFYDIIIGGQMLYYPGTNLLLENGILLDLGYWGCIIGTIKVVCEILITYNTLTTYNLRDRILIMIAIWGVAFMNNNSFQTWLMIIFVITCVALNNYMPYRIALKNKKT